MARNDPTPESDDSKRLWRLAGMGFTLATEILAGTGIGWLLDLLFNTAPTLLVIGTITGLIVGLLTFFRVAIRESRRATSQAARIAGRLRAEGRGARDAGQLDENAHDDGPEQAR